MLNSFKTTIWDEWENKYIEGKGNYYHNSVEKPKNKVCKDIRKLNNKQARIAYRLRAGFTIRIDKDRYWCEVCGQKNDFIHKLFYCQVFVHSREALGYLGETPPVNINQINIVNLRKIIHYADLLEITL